MQLFPVGKVYNFMGGRGTFSLVSLFMVLGSIVLLIVPGPRLGTDFKGGTELEVAFTKPVQEAEIRRAVDASGFSQPDVIRVGDGENTDHFLIRVQDVSIVSEDVVHAIEQALCFGESVECPGGAQATEVTVSPGGEKVTARFRDEPDLELVKTRMGAVDGVSLRKSEANPRIQNARDHKIEILLSSKGDQLLDSLRQQLGSDRVPDAALRVEWVGPKAGALLRDAALKSVAIAMLFIMVYIALRFDLRFAPGAVLALVHDSVVTIGVLVLLKKELSLSTVAAVLTIVGYSVNDTVVVYDRVRENLGRLRGSSFMHVINISLSEMLGRTMLTSGTTVISLLAFFYWGTGTLKEFALTIIIGIVLGTYSSIYVALPLTHWLDRKFFAHLSKDTPRGPVPRKGDAGAVL